jgi:hypothetical protein
VLRTASALMERASSPAEMPEMRRAALSVLPRLAASQSNSNAQPVGPLELILIENLAVAVIGLRVETSSGFGVSGARVPGTPVVLGPNGLLNPRPRKRFCRHPRQTDYGTCLH